MEATHASTDNLEWTFPSEPKGIAAKLLSVLFKFDSEVTTPTVVISFKRDDVSTVIHQSSDTFTSKIVGFAPLPVIFRPGDTIVINTGNATSCVITASFENCER